LSKQAVPTLTPAAAPTKRRAFIIAGGFMAALVSALLLCEAWGWPFLRPTLQTAMQERLQVKVELTSPFKLHLLGQPNLSIAQVKVGAPPELGVPYLLLAKDLQLKWRWADLWARKGQVGPWPLQALSARALDVHLLRLADGRASWPVSADSKAKAAANRPQSPLHDLPVSFAVLGVDTATISYRDALTETDVAIQLTGEQSNAVDSSAISTGFTATAQGRWRTSALALQATAGGITTLLDGSVVPVTVQGRVGNTEISFRGVVADVVTARALRGSLLVRGPSLAAVGDAVGVTLPSTPAFRLAGAVAHNAGVWSVVTTQAHIGGSQLQANLVFDTRPATPLLAGQLSGRLLRLKDLGPAVGTKAPKDTPAMGSVLDDADTAAWLPAPTRPAATKRASTRPASTKAAPTASAPRPGRVLPDRVFDLRALRLMDANVLVAIHTLDLGDDAAIAPLRSLSTHLTLTQGLLTLERLSADAAGGSFSGQTSLDATKTGKMADGAAGVATSARWQADLRFTGLHIEQWLRALQRQGKPLLTGRLEGRLRVQGQGESTAAILSTLQGQVGARVRQGELSHLLQEVAGLDVAQAIGVLLRGDRNLKLACFVLQSQVQSGVLRITEGVADTSDSRILMSGQVNLGDETLALRMAVKPKDFSPFSLRSPILVGGTLSQPSVSVQGKPLAQRLVAAVALAVAAPVAGLIPFLEFGDEPAPKEDPCTQASGSGRLKSKV
jgi:AsmA family protein